MGRKSTHPRLDPEGNPYCSQCHQYLPPGAFTPRTTTVHGYDYACKTCNATNRRVYTAKHHEQHKATVKTRYERYKAMTDDERYSPRAKRCRTCKEARPIAAFHALRRNKDGHYDQCKACYATERNQTPDSPQHYWLAGPSGLEPAALCNACIRIVPLSECRTDQRGYKRVMMRCVTCRTQARTAWRQDHRMQDRLAVHRSRIKHRPHRYGSAIETVTDADIEAIWARYNNACAYCDADDSLTIDHMIPVANGGAHSKENIVPACFSCNSRKRTLSIDEFLARNPHRKDPRIK